MKYRSKKGQLPFVELNGEEIADSAIIIKELSQKFGHDLDACLSIEQRNLAHATISMIENHLAWVVMWWRTKYPDQVLKGYKVNLQHALGTRIPNGILNFFFKFAFGRKVRFHIYWQYITTEVIICIVVVFFFRISISDCPFGLCLCWVKLKRYQNNRNFYHLQLYLISVNFSFNETVGVY